MPLRLRRSRLLLACLLGIDYRYYWPGAFVCAALELGRACGVVALVITQCSGVWFSLIKASYMMTQFISRFPSFFISFFLPASFNSDAFGHWIGRAQISYYTGSGVVSLYK